MMQMLNFVQNVEHHCNNFRFNVVKHQIVQTVKIAPNKLCKAQILRYIPIYLFLFTKESLLRNRYLLLLVKFLFFRVIP
jgi:hypothetical protein